ncbi:hypothetical protein GGH91_000589 [Coemansia sp. RSA 2671]|nr:hypothetical protein LPJ60_002161 [Coemansia sp. RSA 2675]KAJ2349814.1 hypothetical protein GGH91_000589 [Coemansia sp. RSA 2671]
MSGPQQTPTRYPPNQQYTPRPGMPGHMPMGTPTPQQRPGMMQYRPGLQMTPQQQQQLYMSANRGMPMGNMTPQMQAQYTQQLQQQYLHQQQMNGQMRPAMSGMPTTGPGVRPGAPQQQQFMYGSNPAMAAAGAAMHGQQPHPALIQPPTPTQAGRKRKGKPANESTSGMADDGAGSGDELDDLQPYNISLSRYQNNHNLMAEVFVALPTSMTNEPKHFYEEMDESVVAGKLDQLNAAIKECGEEHEGRMQDIKKNRDGFAEMIGTLVNASYEDVDKIKKDLENRFAMEFVNNPYLTVERVAIDQIQPVENAVYKQL